MHTTWQQTNWIDGNSVKRQAIAFVVSLLIVALLLMIPINRRVALYQQDVPLQVVLSKPKPKPKPKPQEKQQVPIETNEPILVEKPVEQQVKQEVVVQKPVKKTVEMVKKPAPVATKPLVVTKTVVQKNPDKAVDNPSKLPSSAVIFSTAYGKVKLYELDDDFKVRTGDEGDFKFREVLQPEWSIVRKIIDEDADKPRIEMDFYSEGIVGSTERFFDKITWKKKITTRYGTKIYCGGVGPLAICSWK